MEPRRDDPSSDRKIMEHIRQEPIAADPIDEGETKDEADDDDAEDDDDDEDETVGQLVERGDER